MDRVLDGSRQKTLDHSGSKSGNMFTRSSLLRKGKVRRLATVTLSFGSWEGIGPTEADAVIFGFIVSALVCTAYAPNEWRVSNCAAKLSSRGSESWELVKSLPTAIDYAERILNRYFPDYPRWK